MQSVNILSDNILSVVRPRVIMPNVVRPSAIMLNVVAPQKQFQFRKTNKLDFFIYFILSLFGLLGRKAQCYKTFILSFSTWDDKLECFRQ
jgi:hypothetical protein